MSYQRNLALYGVFLRVITCCRPTCSAQRKMSGHLNSRLINKFLTEWLLSDILLDKFWFWMETSAEIFPGAGYIRIVITGQFTTENGMMESMVRVRNRKTQRSHAWRSFAQTLCWCPRLLQNSHCFSCSSTTLRASWRWKILLAISKKEVILELLGSPLHLLVVGSWVSQPISVLAPNEPSALWRDASSISSYSTTSSLVYVT